MIRKYYLLTALCCWLTTAVSAQSVADYLNKNSADITQQVTESTIVDADFFDHQIFFLGESHGIRKPQHVDFNFLKLLNQKAGVRTYVAEVDFAKAWYLNEYLDHGGETKLDTVFADWVRQDAQWANKDFQEKIRKIRTLNQTLPASKRIHFTGIDQIHNPVLVATYLDALLAKKPLVRYRSQFNTLSRLLSETAPDSVISKEAGRLMTFLQTNAFAKLASEERQTLTYALTNCVKIGDRREGVIYENFKTCYAAQNWAKQKVYGFWGFSHVLQAKANEGKSSSFVNRLLNDTTLALRGKVLSIGFLYVGCKTVLPTQFMPSAVQDKGKHFTIFDQMNFDGPMTTFSFIDDFKQATQPNTVTLFKLDGPTSPFLHQPVKITYSNFMPANQRLYLNEPGKQMADYFQYVILVRDSPAVTTIVP
jgi:hypothetical protein